MDGSQAMADAKEAETCPQGIREGTIEPEHLLPSPSTSNTLGEKILRSSPVLPKATHPPTASITVCEIEDIESLDSRAGREPDGESNRKRKRLQETEDPAPRIQDGPIEKRARVHGNEAGINIDSRYSHLINHWAQEGIWPREYFEQENGMLGWKKSAASLLRETECGSVMASDLIPRDQKAVPYRHPGYASGLAAKGSYMDESDLGISDESRSLCKILLDTQQEVPEGSLFRDDLFYETCRSVQDRNEARIVRDISPLIVPSGEILAIYNATNPKILIDGVNEGWNNCIPFHGPRPQPDYSVGFRRSTFTEDQLEKLNACTGVPVEDSFTYLTATWRMYFPFLTCEVKSGLAGLDTADRQNAHSMTVALRAIVELYRLVKREKELHGEVLAFSISHDHESVKIYGHYALIDGSKTSFYRHSIHKFNFTALDGKDKWTAYRFTKNVYDIYMPKYRKMICSALDDVDLPTANAGDEPGSSGPPPHPFIVPELPASTVTHQKKKRQRQGSNQSIQQQSASIVSSENETRLQQENERQREEFMEKLQQQMEESERQRREESERLRQESERQSERLRQESEQQRREESERLRQEFMETLKQQREDSERQRREESERLSQESERQSERLRQESERQRREESERLRQEFMETLKQQREDSERQRREFMEMLRQQTEKAKA